MEDPITETIIVKSSAEQAFDAWADLTLLPKFMAHVDRVRMLDDGTTEWMIEGPAGQEATWRAEFTRTQRPDRLAWNSKDDSGPVVSSGQVTFHELPGRQTEVTIVAKFSHRGPAADYLVDRLRNARVQVAADLRAFKAYLEQSARD